MYIIVYTITGMFYIYVCYQIHRLSPCLLASMSSSASKPFISMLASEHIEIDLLFY